MTKKIFFIIFFIFYATKIFTQIYFRSFKNDNLIFSFIHSYEENFLFFQITEKQKILVDSNGNQFEYFSNIYKEFFFKIISQKISLSITTKPLYKFYYNIKLGIIPSQSGNFEGLNEKFSSFNYGWLASFSMKYNFFPESMVSSGLDLILGFEFAEYNSKFLENNQNIFFIDTSFKSFDLFSTFSISKKISESISILLDFSLISRDSVMCDKINFYQILGKKFFLNSGIAIRKFFSEKESLTFYFSKSIFDKPNSVFSVILNLEY